MALDKDEHVVECRSVAEAVHDAGVITLITRASEPFLTAGMVPRGAHINAAGAILPANAEFSQDILGRASLVVVDNVANARKASRELIEHYGQDSRGWSGVRTIGELLDAGFSRPPDADITLFKPMGMGLSDLAVAIIVFERVRGSGIGQVLARGQRTTPQWTAVQRLK